MVIHSINLEEYSFTVTLIERGAPSKMIVQNRLYLEIVGEREWNLEKLEGVRELFEREENSDINMAGVKMTVKIPEFD